MFDKLEGVVKRYEELTEKLADPTLYDRQAEFKKISSERANLEEIVQCFNEYKKVRDEIQDAKDILKSEKDEDLREMAKEELSELEKRLPSLKEELSLLLLPKDPLDDKNVRVEIRAGAGGDEASIFVADVFRMYQNYLRDLGFKNEVISLSEGDEGIKEVIFSVKGEKVYSKLKYESGVHRVQKSRKLNLRASSHLNDNSGYYA